MNRIIEVAVDVGRHLFADRRDVGECPPPTSPSRPLHPNCPSVEVPSAPVTFVADLRHLLDVPGRLDAWPQTSRRVSVPLPTPVVVGPALSLHTATQPGMSWNDRRNPKRLPSAIEWACHVAPRRGCHPQMVPSDLRSSNPETKPMVPDQYLALRDRSMPS